MSEEIARNTEAEIVSKNLGTFEDHESAWKSAYSKMENSAWRLSEISASLVEHFGSGAVEQFARQRGVSDAWIYQLGRAFRLRQTLPEEVRKIRSLPNGRPITITHYVDASFSTEPQRMMRQVIEESLSTTAIRKRVKEEKKRAVASLSKKVQELPASARGEAEKPASRGVIVRKRKNNNETGTMGANIEVCSHCHSPVVAMPKLQEVMDELSLDPSTLQEEARISEDALEDLLDGYAVSRSIVTEIVGVIRHRRAERERRRKELGL